MSPGFFEAIADRDDPGDVLFFGVHVVDEAQHIIRRQQFCRDATIGPPAALERLLSDNAIAWFPALVISRDAFQAVGPFNAESGNVIDLDMWVRLFGAFGIRCVPSAISAYSVHVGSATQTTAFDHEMISRILDIFDRAERLGVVPARVVRECRAQFLPQVILGTAALDLRAGRSVSARRVMALFNLSSVRASGISRAWLPVRTIFSVLVRLPPAIVQPFMRLIDRLDLVRRVRSFQTRGEGTFPFC